MSRLLSTTLLLLVGWSSLADDKKPVPRPEGPPVSADPRLVVELFSAAPDIVQPIATDFDSKGRLLVVESHTHFRPAKYDGPKFDRVRVLEDTDKDGKADKFTTFFEGTTHTMDLAVHFDGSVYVATRNEVLRLRDTDGDGKADEQTRVVFLETKGNYPHNGLGGLMFGSKGDLYFGIGENLGAPYKLIGSDGKALSGGGEGGNVFHCTADGKELRRYATGFWNPFGACRDIFGRMWVVDNDPDASPPCRLLYLVEGGDYGYQFRYGRSGRHPFQAWNGELPGTLPMAAGTGESPCEVISYESDGLPDEYRGHLLVPVWADHRIERYVPRVQGAGMAADRKPFIQGGQEFRPSGMTVAPDGSLFVTDWVSRSYELHGKGAVWHVRWKDAKPAPRPADAKQALVHADRVTRDAAARTLAKDAAGRDHLRTRVTADDVRVRASALTALIDAGDPKTDLAGIARTEKEPALRAAAVRALVTRRADVSAFVGEAEPAVVRVEALAGARGLLAGPPVLPAGASEKFDVSLVQAVKGTDPFLYHAAVRALIRDPFLVGNVVAKAGKNGTLAAILVAREPGNAYAQVARSAIRHPDPDIRFLAIKRVADLKVIEARADVVVAMFDPTLDPRTFLGLATALARLDDKPVNEEGLANYFFDRLMDKDADAMGRTMALRLIPAGHPKLKTATLLDLSKSGDHEVRIEALRALTEKADAAASARVREIATDPAATAHIRAQAVATLAAGPAPDVTFLLGIAEGRDRETRDEALRGLTGAKLDAAQKARLGSVAADPATADLVGRLTGKNFAAGRPAATDTAAWLKHLDGPGDVEAGRRIFENPKVVSCARCHKVDGRGSNVGPDLSLVGRTERKWILESILQPAASVAPHYTPWQVTTLDGRSRVGLLVHTNLDESFYIDEKGERFKVEAKDLDEAVPAKGSVMPNGLTDGLTDQEIRDLVAYLQSRK